VVCLVSFLSFVGVCEFRALGAFTQGGWHLWLCSMQGQSMCLCWVSTRGAGWLGWVWFESCGCVSVVNFVEGYIGWEQMLKWAWEAFAEVKLVKAEAATKVVPGGSGDLQEHMRKPVRVVGAECE